MLFCQNPDSIEHVFLDCNITTSFLSNAFAWFNQAHSSAFYFSSKQITLNDITATAAYQVSDPPTKHRLHLTVKGLKENPIFKSSGEKCCCNGK